ncbi:MAG: DUF6056 family protein [Bifidobacteriaceae bacterium]|nr:DUF6056 family protein [Bifidobacteriaceae bacterium]
MQEAEAKTAVGKGGVREWWRRRPRLFVAVFCLAVGSVGLFGYLVAALLVKPIGDDYLYFHNAREFGTVGSVFYHMEKFNGRYSPQLFVAIAYRLFGVGASRVGCTVFILLAWIAFTVAAAQFLPLRRKYHKISAACIGTVTAFAFMAAAPSVFDSFYWMTSAVHYSLPVSLLALTAVLVARLLGAWRHRPRLTRTVITCLTCLAVFMSAGINELITALGLGLLVLLLLVDALTKRWRCRGVLGLLTASALAGLAITYFAPGATQRRGVTMAEGPIANGLRCVGLFFENLAASSLGTMILVWSAVALAVLAVTTPPSPRLARWVLAAGVLIGVGGSWAFAFGIGFAAAVTPYRAQVLPEAALGLGLAVCLVACGWLVSAHLESLSWRWAPVAACLMVALAVAATAGDTLGLIRALALRGQMVVQRDIALAEAVAAGETEIEILPAPILFAPAQGTDISFNPDRRNYFVSGYRSYMRVPADTVFVLQAQPAGYCLSTPAPGFSGARTCQQLARLRD